MRAVLVRESFLALAFQNYFCMKSLFLILSSVLTAAAYGQKEIKLEEASRHIGDSVKICGTVAASRYMNMAEGGPTLFYLGDAFPKQTLTLVVWKKDRKFFTKPPELAYAQQDVCATGKLELVAGKPQISLYNETQIKVVEEEEGE
jgi:hypothetical protein